MKLADDIWLGSVAARNNLLAAANYSAAFFGNAAVQSWTLGLSTPMVFWSAMARAIDKTEAAADNLDAVPVAEAPVLSVVEPVAAPAEIEIKAEVEVAQAEAPAPDMAQVEEAPQADPSPLLLDAPRGGEADDLKLVKGIGAKMEASLNEFGIYHFDQIAGLDENGIAWLDQHLPGFKRNCARFDLVSGAKALL
jgi:predicted flap endonuclease-1-like 5' DNA nuclease